MIAWLKAKLMRWLEIDDLTQRHIALVEVVAIQVDKLKTKISNEEYCQYTSELERMIKRLEQAIPSFQKCEIYVAQHEKILEEIGLELNMHKVKSHVKFQNEIGTALVECQARLEKEIEARREGQCKLLDNVKSLRQFIVDCAKFSDEFVKRYNRDRKKKRGKHGKAKSHSRKKA